MASYSGSDKGIQYLYDKVMQFSTIPVASATLEGKIVQYVGDTTVNFINGYFYKCTESSTPGTYEWTQLNVQDDEDTIIQFTIMPEASASNAGRIVQYTGETSANFTKGYFYKCEVGEIPATYQAPNGNMYRYKVTSRNINGYWYSVYGNNKIAFIQGEEDSGNYWAYICCKYNTTQLIARVQSRSGSTEADTWSVWCPDGQPYSVNSTEGYVVFWHDESTPTYNNSFSCIPSANPNIPILESKQAAYDYLYAPTYVWTQVDTQSEYSLPMASANTLGGIKVGQNLSIDENGVLSASDSYVLPAATASTLGGIKVGDNISVDAQGSISVDAPIKYSVVSASSIGAVTSETEIASFPFYPDGDTCLLLNGSISGEVTVTGLICEVTIKVKLDGVDNLIFKQSCAAGYHTIPISCGVNVPTATNHIIQVTVSASDGSITL